eukprot:gene16097-19154_t
MHIKDIVETDVESEDVTHLKFTDIKYRLKQIRIKDHSGIGNGKKVRGDSVMLAVSNRYGYLFYIDANGSLVVASIKTLLDELRDYESVNEEAIFMSLDADKVTPLKGVVDCSQSPHVIVALSYDEMFLAVVSGSLLQVFSVADLVKNNSAKPLGECQFDESPIESIAWSLQGYRMLVVTENTSLYLYNHIDGDKPLIESSVTAEPITTIEPPPSVPEGHSVYFLKCVHGRLFIHHQEPGSDDTMLIIMKDPPVSSEASSFFTSIFSKEMSISSLMFDYFEEWSLLFIASNDSSGIDTIELFDNDQLIVCPADNERATIDGGIGALGMSLVTCFTSKPHPSNSKGIDSPVPILVILDTAFNLNFYNIINMEKDTQPAHITQPESLPNNTPSLSSSGSSSIKSPSPSMIAYAKTPAPVFGITSPTSSSSLCTTMGPTPAPFKSAFGDQSTLAPSVFGSKPAPSIFGNNTSPLTTTAPLFGSTPPPSLFGNTPATTAVSAPMFGSTPSKTSTTPATTTTAAAALFGSTPAPSLFGTTPATTKTGTATTTTSPITTTAPLFGSTTAPSMFGTTPATTTQLQMHQCLEIHHQPLCQDSDH